MGKITIKAKNLYKIVEKNYITKVGGTLTKTFEEVNIYTTEGSINMYSNTSIDMKADQEIPLGDYVEPPESTLTKHPDIEKVEFIDVENDTVLSQSTINGIEGGNATQFLYGKKLKIRITFTEEPKKGSKEKIEIKLKGKSKNTSQKFVDIDKLKWTTNIENKILETDPFIVPLSWYNEDFEFYDYDSHSTKIKSEDLNSFSLETFHNSRIAFLPKKINHLKPIAYRRNYEELIGLFKTDDSGDKDLSSNYENKFISYNSEILSLVKEFFEFLQTEDLKINDIKKRVETDAKQLWGLAVKQVQGYDTIAPYPTTNYSEKVIAEGSLTKEDTHKIYNPPNLDDRPLYWARNKMQVRLKRHPIFEDNVDLETSIVCKDTELESIITLFEELSRNYTGVDFSKAPSGTKKVLITGFDPFILNSFKHPNIKGNILQSNPSGCLALSLSKNNEIGANIQTLIVPVRYTDFDGSTDPKEGHGEGVVEKYIKPFIEKVDMIITISQAGPKDFNIDKYATATRGGFNDNSDFIRVDGSHAIKTDDEWIETTLPKEMTNAPFVKYNWNYDGENGELIPPKVGQKISYGPGGSYLSNEIFYRVAKLRKDNKPTLPTGHFHISKIQENGEDLNHNEIKELLSVVKQAIVEGIKAI